VTIPTDANPADDMDRVGVLGIGLEKGLMVGLGLVALLHSSFVGIVCRNCMVIYLVIYLVWSPQLV